MEGQGGAGRISTEDEHCPQPTPPPPAPLTLSFLRALNFFKHSTVSCLCIMEATVERCCGGQWGQHQVPAVTGLG